MVIWSQAANLTSGSQCPYLLNMMFGMFYLWDFFFYLYFKPIQTKPVLLCFCIIISVQHLEITTFCPKLKLWFLEFPLFFFLFYVAGFSLLDSMHCFHEFILLLNSLYLVDFCFLWCYVHISLNHVQKKIFSWSCHWLFLIKLTS